MSQLYSATLRIYTGTPHTAHITAALGVEPSSVVLIGTPINPRNPGGPIHPETIWFYKSPLKAGDLSDHISTVIRPLERGMAHPQELLPGILAKNVFCFFSSENGQGTFEISSELLGRLDRLGLDLVVDCYLTCE